MIDQSRCCVGLVAPENNFGSRPLKIVELDLPRQQDVTNGLFVLADPEGDADSDDRSRF